jgi:hypothetical protein
MAGIFADKNHPFIASAPAATPHFFLYLMLAVAVFYAMLAAWATLTVIGILRLRSWARYSILIIGGGLAVLWSLCRRGHPRQPHHAPKPLRSTTQCRSAHPLRCLFVLTAFYLFVSAIGVWWLIYFNLRAIRDLFSGTRFQIPSSTGIPASPNPVPTPIKIIAVFLFIGSACCLLCLFLPFPAFFLGFILPLTATQVLYLALAALAAFAGYGLLRLKESARLLTMASLILGFCNVAMAALPWYQSRFQTYTPDHSFDAVDVWAASIPGHS